MCPLLGGARDGQVHCTVETSDWYGLADFVTRRFRCGEDLLLGASGEGCVEGDEEPYKESEPRRHIAVLCIERGNVLEESEVAGVDH